MRLFPRNKEPLYDHQNPLLHLSARVIEDPKVKNKFFIIISIFTLFYRELHAREFHSEVPLEAAILQLPDDSTANWKELSRSISKEEGVIEVIPCTQTVQNWSELIGILYDAKWNKKTAHSIDDLVDHILRSTLSSYPPNIISWQIIEKNDDDIIYEWMLRQSYKTDVIEHEIARAFLTSTGFHRVGFTRKYRLMSAEEREKWIKLLKENISILPFQEGSQIEGISMAEALKDSISLGVKFQNWEAVMKVTTKEGISLIRHLPPTHVGPEVIESLDTTIGSLHFFPSLDRFIEMEKEYIRDKAPRKVKFRTLERSPSEIIYSYSYPKDHLQLNAVVRTFRTDHGYYSISYKHSLKGKLQKDEILQWQENLKAICVES
ncbi:MAG: hypothetical protein JSR80_00075 [Verrucomicrobia bacterium]|nr:hypothetical protein [Verrucomicrobiota bacterium]